MINTRAQKARSELVTSLGRIPTDGELAKSIGVKLDTLEWARTSAAAKVISAQTVLGSENDGGENIVTYLDMFLRADQEDFSSDDMMWHVDFNAALDCLTPQERRTVSIRYGLMDGKTRTVERTADLMCMSSEAVRLIVLSALDKLRSSPFWETLSNGPPQHPVTTFNGKMGALAY
jgi:RNA polymerase primary sigma factor